MNSALIKIQKKIFKEFKKKAYAFEENLSKELISYRRDFERSAKRPFSPSSDTELFKSVLRSDFIFIGDFHTFEQNARTALRIMRRLRERNLPYILALEMVDAENQYLVDSFHQDYITEFEFLDSIDYYETWRFPWAHYKLLFDEAKINLSPIEAINTKGSLRSRDEFAAKKLVELKEKNKDSKIIVFYGEYHIEPHKIPKLIKKKSKSKFKNTLIFQNLDEAYLKLLSKNKETDIVKFNQNEFCINASPPWIKYDSLIYWFENYSDVPEFDIHEQIIKKGIKIFSDEAQDSFHQILSSLIKTIKIKESLDDIYDFNLYDYRAFDFIEEELRENLPQKIAHFYAVLLQLGESFRLPNKPSFYCANYSFNRLSYLGGIQIYHAINLRTLDTVKILNQKNNINKFCYFLFTHLFAHFFSKIINPHRKCDLYLDLEKKYKETKDKELELSLMLLNGKNLSLTLKGERLLSLHKVSQVMGHLFGEYLYDDYAKSKGFFSKRILKLIPNLENYEYLKENILGKVDYKKHNKRLF